MDIFLHVLTVLVVVPVILAKIALALSPDKIEQIIRKHHDEYGEVDYKAAAFEIWRKNWL